MVYKLGGLALTIITVIATKIGRIKNASDSSSSSRHRRGGSSSSSSSSSRRRRRRRMRRRRRSKKFSLRSMYSACKDSDSWATWTA